MDHAAAESHLAHDLVRIHKVITRGLSILRRGIPDAEARRGFLDFAQCVVTTLRGHHDLEEEVVFPRLGKLTEAPFARLEEQHRGLIEHLNAGESAIAAARTPAGGASIAGVVAAADRLEPLWLEHIGIEEAHFTPAALDTATTPAERAELGRLVGEHAQRHSQPAPLILPFVLYSLEGSDRAALAARFPPPVIQLIPGPWKAEWAPMAPYLLI
jgi:hypothetical protein